MTRREFLRLALGTAVGLAIPRTLSASGQSAPSPTPAPAAGWGLPWVVVPSKQVRVFVPLVIR